jgi:hypothetical protein
VHALWQPKDFAGRQRSPHAAEHDDDESGATALTEGVGATAGGRGKRLRRGKYGWDRIARQPPVEGSHVGRRQQNRRATSFLGPDLKAGGHCRKKAARVYAVTCLPTSSDEVRTFLNLRRRASNTPRKGGRTPTIVFYGDEEAKPIASSGR